MATQADLVLSNLGFKAYMYNYADVKSLIEAADGDNSKTITMTLDESKRLYGVTNVGGFGVTTNTVDGTELDGDGWTRFVATNKQANPLTMSFFVRDKNTYNRLYAQAYDKETSSEDYYAAFILIYPKKSGTEQVDKDFSKYRDKLIIGCVTEFTPSEADVSTLQSFSITINNQGRPYDFVEQAAG